MSLKSKSISSLIGLAAMGMMTCPTNVMAAGAFSAQGGEYRIAGELAGEQTKVSVSYRAGKGLMVWNDNYVDQKGLG
ncbi:MAG TPA: hypothetical protein DCY13_11165, partial [Verrucomicrobiales bacterium]|nr:hypothetical protein [Verrucomicrobiales bacterium]